ncbi:MAG: hypothetical protein JSW72_05020 [Candidatus Bathyarchaeota archaeon]|nr:MAG: hypothetical protein JSW72_05020 [Candidatus Bathyarchaeota archaeon]
MKPKLKPKLLTTNPFEVIEKMAETTHKAAENPFAAAILVAPSFRPRKTSKACRQGSRVLRHVKVNYPYKKKIPPRLY